MVRERRFGLRDLWGIPLEWLSSLNARMSGSLNQERWANVLILVSLILVNLMLLLLIVSGQENYAIVYSMLIILAPLMFLVPEISITLFISAGAGLFVNTAYYVAGPGGGTGERTLTLFFLAVLSVRAIYEYFQIPKDRRPRVFSWFISVMLIFWCYYIAHVIYIYLFRYDYIPTDRVDVILGFYRRVLLRFFDAHMLWIGILPLIVLLRDFQRARRVLFILGTVIFLCVGSVIWEYLAPLPEFWKVVFLLRVAGETTEGYRVRDPVAIYLIVFGFFFAIFSLGYFRWRITFIMLVYIALASYAIMITKNRALWAGILAFLPLALLWKPPVVLVRQAQIALVGVIVSLSLTLHPTVSEVASRIWLEAVQRWERNYAYGGDPRLDPSYQARVREKEAWEYKMQKANFYQRLIGFGLEEPYGRFVPLYDYGAAYQNPRFQRTYLEKTDMHFAWLARQLHIGWIGTGLLALVLVAFFVRAGQAFFATRDPFVRSLLMGLVGATISVIAYDMIHSDVFDDKSSLPIILLWAVCEAVFYWRQTGQIESNPRGVASIVE